MMRPEVLESNFYAWRVTGDIKYYNNAVKAVKSFNNYLAVENGTSGYAGLHDVTGDDPSYYIDHTESFWFAEVLKYLYASSFAIV